MKLPAVAVIDYGMGNLRSVAKALEVAGARPCVTNSVSEIKSAEAVIFPGVGSFGPAIENITKAKLDAAITESIASGRMFLGLCLGFQLLFTYSALKVLSDG